jgi:hypothetical protein
MSMSVEQRRTQVLDRHDFPAGSVRLTKASSRYDRRHRHFAVEFLPADARGTELEDYRWTVLADWPVASGQDEPDVFYRGAWRAIEAIEPRRNHSQGDPHV